MVSLVTFGWKTCWSMAPLESSVQVLWELQWELLLQLEAGGVTPGPGGGCLQLNPGSTTPGDNEQQRQNTNTTVKNEAHNNALFDEFRRRKVKNKEISISSFKKKKEAMVMEIKPLPPSMHGAGAEYMCPSAALVTWCQEC